MSKIPLVAHLCRSGQDRERQGDWILRAGGLGGQECASAVGDQTHGYRNLN